MPASGAASLLDTYGTASDDTEEDRNRGGCEGVEGGRQDRRNNTYTKSNYTLEALLLIFAH